MNRRRLIKKLRKQHLRFWRPHYYIDAAIDAAVEDLIELEDAFIMDGLLRK